MGRNNLSSIRFSNRKILVFTVLFLLAVGGCILVCWIFLCLAARVLCSVDVPATMYISLSTGCCAAAIFLVCCFFLHQIGRNGLLWGSMIAAGTWSLFVLIGTLRGGSFSELSFFRAVLYLCCGMFGGMLGVLLHEQRKKMRK